MKNIVVVDDQPVLASIYRAKFVAEGFHVEVASDGQQALELIERVKPDLVLLDLMLPKIKGIDVLKKVRANPLFETLPIIVFSNSGQPEAVEDAWTAGASMVLSKSKTSPKQMVESVVSALASSDRTDKDAPAVSEFVDAKDIKRSLPAAKRKERVLIIEINSETREMLGLLMSNQGYQLSNADGPGHALLLSEIAHFDLVLVNRALCHDSYASFCRQIRRRHSQLPVVMYSMNATPTETKEALANGVSRYLITPAELLNVAEISSILLAEERTAASPSIERNSPAS
jgi:CheY-like chemotaxis protein